MDLPAADDSAGLSEYADAVVGAIGDRIDLVLVAQSLGGFTAPLVCEQVSVDLLGTLNAMVPSPGGFAGEWWTNTGHAKARVEQAARDVRDLTADEGLRDALFHDVPARGHGRGVGEGRAKPVRDAIRAAVAPAEVARGADEVPAGPRRSLLPGGISAQGRGRTFGHYPRPEGWRAPRRPQPPEGAGRPPGGIPGGHRRRSRWLTGKPVRCKIQRRRSL
jgi:hypothetical protein